MTELPINPFRSPQATYPVPIPIIDHEPDEDMIFLGVSKYWLPALVGCAQTLTQQATWDTSDPDDLGLAVARAQELLYRISLANTIDLVCAQFNGWHHVFDFTVADGSWASFGITGSNWVSGVGWGSNTCYNVGSGYYVTTAIKRTFSATTITFMDLEYSVQPISIGGGNDRLSTDDDASIIASQADAVGTGRHLVYLDPVGVLIDDLEIVIAPYQSAIPFCPGYGVANISRLTLSGPGSDPF